MKKIFTSLLALGFLWMNGYSQVYLDEGFDTEIPATWTTTSDGDAFPWSWTDAYGWNSDNLGSGGMAMVDADAAGSANNLIEYLEAPSFDASAGNIVVVQFDQFYNEYINQDTGRVQVWDGTAWNTVYEVHTDDVGSWANPDARTIIITDHVNPSGDTKVRWFYDDGDTYAYYWAIDNVVISSVDCLEPINISIEAGAVESVVSWDSGSGTSNLLWGDEGFDPDTEGTLVSAAANPYTIMGLDPETSYDVYLQDDCGTDGLSAWEGPNNFVTTVACPDPYMQWNPWTDVSSFYAEFVYTSNGIGDVYMILGPADFVPGDPLSDTLLLTGSPFMVTGLDAETDYDAYIYMDCTANPDDSLGYSANIGPKGFMTLPSCPTPTQSWPYDENETTNSTEITYELNGPGDGYIVYGPSGFVPGDPNSDTTALTGSPFTLTGLDPLTFYDYFIFMDCNADGYDYSENSTTRTFNTLTDAAGTSCGDPFILSSANLPYTSVAQSMCGYGNNVTNNPCNLYAGYEEIVYVYAPESDDEILSIYGANSTTNSSIYFSITTMCPDSSGSTCVASGTMSYNDVTYQLVTEAGDLTNGETYYITVSGYTGTDCFVDLNISLITCNTPGNLTSVNYTDSTVLTWDFVNDSTTEWQVVWGPQGFDPATEGDSVITGNYANGQESATTYITGLSDTTSYDFYVTDVCGFNNVAIPAGPGVFVGPPPVNDLCANATTIMCGETLMGSNITANNEGNDLSTCTDWPYEPENATVWYTLEGDGNEIVLTTCGTGWNTGLWVYSGECDSLECIASETGNYYLGEYQCTGSYTTDTYISFQSEVGVTYTVAVAAGTTWNPPTGQFYLTMECIPCSAPYELDVMSVSNDAALINWETFNDGADFTYEYGIAPLTPGMGTSVSGVVGVDGPTVMIEGLLADTLYDFYMFEVCTEGMTDTLWTDFTTNEFAPPANDLCANATVLECGDSDTSSTQWATTFENPLGGQCGNEWDVMNVNTIWYSFVGTGQEMNVGTCGSNLNGGSYYAELFIFTGMCDSLECFQQSSYNTVPDCDYYGSTNVSFFGELGVTYYIGMTATSSYYAAGETVITLECIDCSTPTDLAASVTDVTASISWNSYNPNADFTLHWDSAGFDFPTELGNIVTGSYADLPVMIDGLLADGTYDVYVYEYCTSISANTDTVDFSFTTNPLPPQVNDNICNAIALVAGDTLATSNEYGSVEVGEPSPESGNCNDPDQMTWCTNTLISSSWYTYTPAMTGYATISTCMSGEFFDSQMAVYTMDDCDGFVNWELVFANDDNNDCPGGTGFSSTVSGCLEGGVTYYIQVDPYSNSNEWSEPGELFSLWLTFEGAQATTVGAFPGIHDATINWNYTADIGGNVDYTLYYTNTVTGVEEMVTGNSADNPTVLTGLDDDTEYTYYIVCNDVCGSTTEVDDFVTLFDGISELGFGKNVNVYPNPVSDKLTIEINTDVNEGSVISIINMQGKIIYSETVKENTSDYRTEIDVDNYARGIYLLKLEDENSSIQQRIIVQ